MRSAAQCAGKSAQTLRAQAGRAQRAREMGWAPHRTPAVAFCRSSIAGSYLLHSPAVLHVSLRELADWLAQGKARGGIAGASLVVVRHHETDTFSPRLSIPHQIKINVSHTFPLEQANRAFGALLNRDAIGKVLLVTGAQAKL